MEERRRERQLRQRDGGTLGRRGADGEQGTYA